MLRRLLGALAVVLGLAAVAGLVLVRTELERRSPVFDPPQVVRVAGGEPLPMLAKRLGEQGVLASPLAFRALARLRGEDRRVRSGLYEFAGNATAADVLDALVRGPQKLELVSFPEGWPVERIALRLEAAGLGPAERYRELAENPAFAASVGVPAPRLEGYLFPDTYSFGDDPTPEEVLGRMTARFHEVTGERYRRAAEEAGLTLHEAVTLPSLGETEAAVPEERPLISAVFHNRLERGMKLQTDPTVLYGVPGRTPPIRQSDLARATPYNTYVVPGLPPGPIANPGLSSLDAAVHPLAGTRALYFVARADRTHQFSETLAAHVRAVQQHQR